MTERYFTFLKISADAIKLSADARPKVRYEYFVTGQGPFPADMLRYDAAWPADPESAAKLAIGFWDRDLAYKQNRSIRLRSFHIPTIDRWSSFGWSVGKESLEQGETR